MSKKVHIACSLACWRHAVQVAPARTSVGASLKARAPCTMKAGTSSIFALHASSEEAERASSYASRHQERAGAPDLVADR
jgi:hypothetical protein